MCNLPVMPRDAAKHISPAVYELNTVIRLRSHYRSLCLSFWVPVIKKVPQMFIHQWLVSPEGLWEETGAQGDEQSYVHLRASASVKVRPMKSGFSQAPVLELLFPSKIKRAFLIMHVYWFMCSVSLCVNMSLFMCVYCKWYISISKLCIVFSAYYNEVIQ